MRLIAQELARPRRECRRPPRHARPKGRTTQAERAPFPIVAGEIPADVAIAASLVVSLGVSPLSPLNREVLRNMFRRDMSAAFGRRMV